jgi:UDP-N-acetylmuramoylalanine--D-glutamate ligase
MLPVNNAITESLTGKKILILGFGKEGISTYNFIIKSIPGVMITIADQDEELPGKINFKINDDCKVILGQNYLDSLDDFDVIIKSPGIPYGLFKDKTDQKKITSQTELFLRSYADRTIGITGTKGKSTTSSLIKHILSSHFNHVMLVGNIGKPPFDQFEQIGPETMIVFEISSHQLENINVSPFIAVILNIYQEHLDHYENYGKYQLAKINITKFQTESNWLVLNADDVLLNDLYNTMNLKRRCISFSQNEIIGDGCYLNKTGKVFCSIMNKISEFDLSGRQYLPGDHNLMNIMAAVCVSKILDVPDAKIYQSVIEFRGLPHRMEYLGEFHGIHFYNDSISTIPQATIQAIKSLKNVDTLILGGKDRGIDYSPLIDFLPVSGVKNIIFIGKAGRRVYEGAIIKKRADQLFYIITEFNEIRSIVKKHTKPGTICLLSPAASSYDMFRNFEERGEVFKKIAENL